MLEQRQALIEERRKAAIATRLQKESIAKMMEEVRTNASKANKIIGQALTGNMNVDALLRSGSAATSPSRKGIKNRSGETEFESRTVGLGRTSKSAGNELLPDKAKHEASKTGGILYSKPQDQPAQPFISPYAIPATER
jgi:CobQ-like glutamine amidotransferase family enzyme